MNVLFFYIRETFQHLRLLSKALLAFLILLSMLISVSPSTAIPAPPPVWTERTSSDSKDWNDIASSADGNKLVATANSDSVYTSADAGATWVARTSTGSRFWGGVASSGNGTKLAAASYNGFIYTSSDSGVNWTEQTGSGSRYWYSITSSSDGTKLAAIVDSGYIYTSSDSGVTWTQRTSDTTRAWASITSSSDGTKLAAVASRESIYTSSDSGVTWTEQTLSGSKGWRSIASSGDGAKLTAAVYGGYIYTSTDYGVNWTEQTSSGSKPWISVASSGNGAKLAAVFGGDAIYTSVDSGATWAGSSDSGVRWWSAITSSNGGTKLAATVQAKPLASPPTNGYIYTYSDPLASEVNCGIGSYTITSGVASNGSSCTGALAIASDVTEIASYAFYDAPITSLTLPSTLATIRTMAFAGANLYPTLTIPNSVTTIEEVAFQQAQFSTLVIGNGLADIQNSTFYRNYGTRISSITFGTGLRTIGYAAFQNFGVNKVVIPEGVTTISERAFDSASTKILVLPNSLTTLVAGAFPNTSLDIVKYCGATPPFPSDYFRVPTTCGAIVDFDANLGSGSMNLQSSTTSAALTANSFTRSGYIFTGWNTQADGLGTPYTNRGTFPFPSPTSDTTLYAQWFGTPVCTITSASENATAGAAVRSYFIGCTTSVRDFSISPAISNGLTFDAATGRIGGSPTSAAPAKTYTITGTNAGGSSDVTYSITVTAAAAPVIEYVPPTPVPFLKTLTAPQMHLAGGKLVCSAGTYQTGQTLDGVVQTSSTALFTPTNYVFNLLVNGQAQSALIKTISSNSVQWDLSIAPSTSTVSCSVTVTANSLTNTDKSTSNTTGLSAANSTLAQATTDASNAYSAAQSANSTTYQKALVDNRALWRKQVESIRANYYESLARITASSGSRKMITDKSTALKVMVAAQKKSAADYKASGLAALVARDAANKVALEAKNSAIAKANASYGTFIESIGYGVLIP
jgi:uncharacterized repeat protein (TIGR02543 family)